MPQQGIHPSQRLVDRLLSLCVDLKKGDLAIKIARREGVPLQQSSFHLALRACAVSGQVHQASSFLDDMRDAYGVTPDKVCYINVLHACALQGEWEEALRIYGEMRRQGLYDGVEAVAHVVRALCRGNQLHKAQSLINQAQESEKPALYEAAIEGCCREGGDVKAGIQLLHDVWDRGIAIGSTAIKAVLGASRRERRLGDALDVLKRWEQPDPVAYSIVIGTSGAVGKWQEALRLFHEMQSRGLVADPVAYLEVMDACDRSGRWQEVLALLGGPPQPPPDIRVYNAAMRACMRAKQFEAVMQVWHKISHDDSGLIPSQATANYAMRAYLNSGRWQEAITLYSNNKTSPLPSPCLPSVEILQEAYFLGLISLQRSSSWDKFLLLVKDLAQKGVPVNDRITRAINMGVSSCVRDKRWGCAISLLESMAILTVLPDVIACNAAIKAYGEMGQYSKAMDLFDSMLDRDLTPDDVTFSTVIRACGQAGRWKEALSLLNAMESKGLLVDNELAYAVALDTCSRAGEFNQAIEISQKMARNGLLDRAVSYNAILGLCQRAGDWERALAILQEMESRGLQPDTVG